MTLFRKALCLLAAAVILLPQPSAAGDENLRIGFFPNVTHAHALVLQSLSREGRSELLPPDLRLDWKAFNAGPAAMEALYAGAVDVTYVGPSPVLNAFMRAGGKGVSVLAGAARGGAGLVVRKGSGLRRPEDFRGKRILTPQLGNTQDIACRNWLADGGLKITLGGGDARVIPTANPDQLAMFVSGHADAVWTVEPWLSRLLAEGGELALAESPETCIVTVLAVRSELLEQAPATVHRLLALHEAVSTWIREHPEDARRRVTEELSRITRRDFPPALVDAAWERMDFRTDIAPADFESSFEAALKAGFLKQYGEGGPSPRAIVHVPPAGGGGQLP